VVVDAAQQLAFGARLVLLVSIALIAVVASSVAEPVKSPLGAPFAPKSGTKRGSVLMYAPAWFV